MNQPAKCCCHVWRCFFFFCVFLTSSFNKHTANWPNARQDAVCGVTLRNTRILSVFRFYSLKTFLTFKARDNAPEDLWSADVSWLVEYFVEVTERNPALVQCIYQGRSLSCWKPTVQTQVCLYNFSASLSFCPL